MFDLDCQYGTQALIGLHSHDGEASLVDDFGNVVRLPNPRLARAFFNAAFWQYVR